MHCTGGDTRRVRFGRARDRKAEGKISECDDGREIYERNDRIEACIRSERNSRPRKYVWKRYCSLISCGREPRCQPKRLTPSSRKEADLVSRNPSKFCKIYIYNLKREIQEMIKALLLDFNGVVINDEPIQMRAYQQVLAKEGIGLTEDDYYS